MNKLKNKLLNNKLSLGTWIQIGNGDIAEIAANQGFDWCAVDLEHTGIGYDAVSDIFRGLKGAGCAPLARVASDSLMDIRKPLDLGAEGVIVPLAENVEQVKKIVEAAKYPLKGRRGAAFCRANQWGDNFDSYIKSADNDILLIVMIETRAGVENIEPILKIEGVDGVFIGPYDMSCSYGVPGQIESDYVVNGISKVMEACKKYKKIAGQHLVVPGERNVTEAVKQGYTFLALGMDTVFVRQGFKKVLELASKIKNK